MNLLNHKAGKFILLIGTVSLLFSCANTKISQSWVEPDNKKAYNDLLIIGIGENPQSRRDYESYFVEELSANSTKAEASYKLMEGSEKIERESVQQAIKGLEIDGVIMTHVVAVDEETVYRPGTGYVSAGYAGFGGYGRGMYGYYPHVSTYVTSPGYYTTHETYTLETNLYDAVTEKLVWTARSRTFSPSSVDDVIVDLTKLLIKDLKEKNLIKEK